LSAQPQPAGVIELEKARELLRKHEEEWIILDPKDPRSGAEEYLRRRFTTAGVRTLHLQAGQFYRSVGATTGLPKKRRSGQTCGSTWPRR
jgi:hypothetical protein